MTLSQPLIHRIVVYDSGIGGRAVLDAVRFKLQKQIDLDQIIVEYFADTQHFPYGTKTDAQLQAIIQQNLDQFRADGYDTVLVACNTASVIIDRCFPQSHIVTIIQPTIEKVCADPPRSLVVIGTEFTIRSQIFSTQIHRQLPTLDITQQAEQELVRMVEDRAFHGVHERVQAIIGQMQSGQTLLLGCTHFSVVKELFDKEILLQHKQIEIIDPSQELTDRVVRIFAR